MSAGTPAPMRLPHAAPLLAAFGDDDPHTPLRQGRRRRPAARVARVWPTLEGRKWRGPTSVADAAALYGAHVSTRRSAKRRLEGRVEELTAEAMARVRAYMRQMPAERLERYGVRRVDLRPCDAPLLVLLRSKGGQPPAPDRELPPNLVVVRDEEELAVVLRQANEEAARWA